MTNFQRYTDDPDAHITRQITDRQDNPLTFTPLVYAIRPGYDAVTLTAAWEGDPGPQRNLRVTVAGLETPGGYWDLWLNIPGDNDVQLGGVRMDTHGYVGG